MAAVDRCRLHRPTARRRLAVRYSLGYFTSRTNLLDWPGRAAEPLNLGPTLLVKTDGAVDVADVARKVIDALKAQQTIALRPVG